MRNKICSTLCNNVVGGVRLCTNSLEMGFVCNACSVQIGDTLSVLCNLNLLRLDSVVKLIEVDLESVFGRIDFIG